MNRTTPILRYTATIGGQQIDFGFIKGGDATDEGKMFQRAIERLSKIESLKDGFERAGKLTAAGIKDELSKTYGGLANENEREIADVERLLHEASERADKLATSGVPPLEPSDAAGALADRELRDYWRSLSTDERQELHVAMSQGEHPDLAIALLRGPAVITRLLPQRRASLQDVLIKPEKRQQLEYVRAHMERLRAAKQALGASNQAMRVRAGIKPSEGRAAQGKPSLIDECKERLGLISNAD